jgi:hypothetical protein
MPKKKSPQDERLEESIAPLIVSYKYECERSDEAQRRDVGYALNILETILRLFIFKS